MKMNAAESFSRVPLEITVLGKGKLKGEIIRHMAPSTNLSIIRKGRVMGRVTLEGDSVIMLTNIKAAAEKQKTQFAAGDIAFLPLNGALYIFSADKVTARPMNYVGRVTEDSGLLKKIGRGDTLVLEVVQAPPASTSS
jgi:hypothetical protein